MHVTDFRAVISGRFSLAANATWRFDDNIICEDFRKPIDVAGVECFRPFLERFACRISH